jgi:hypothetical protein
VRIANESYGNGRRRSAVVQFEPHSILVIDLYLSEFGIFQFLVIQTFQPSQCQLARGIFDSVQLVPARFDNADWQTELVGLICPYERETLVGELNPHTTDNMSPLDFIVNMHIGITLQYELFA